MGDGKVIKSIAKVYYHSKKKRFMMTSFIGCQKEAARYDIMDKAVVDYVQRHYGCIFV